LNAISSVMSLRPLEVQAWRSGVNDRECASIRLEGALHMPVGIAYGMSREYAKPHGVPGLAILRGT
jgi:hypothetical protein